MSLALIGGGFWLIAGRLEGSVRGAAPSILATTGVYAYVRHPQHAGFVLVMFGFLLQWPTLLTLFPVLVLMYVRLARTEEREALAQFSMNFERYMRDVPAFIAEAKHIDRQAEEWTDRSK